MKDPEARSARRQLQRHPGSQEWHATLNPSWATRDGRKLAPSGVPRLLEAPFCRGLS